MEWINAPGRRRTRKLVREIVPEASLDAAEGRLRAVVVPDEVRKGCAVTARQPRCQVMNIEVEDAGMMSRLHGGRSEHGGTEQRARGVLEEGRDYDQCGGAHRRFPSRRSACSRRIARDRTLRTMRETGVPR
jgi:hypothetical protein